MSNVADHSSPEASPPHLAAPAVGMGAVGGGAAGHADSSLLCKNARRQAVADQSVVLQDLLSAWAQYAAEQRGMPTAAFWRGIADSLDISAQQMHKMILV